MKSKSFTIEVDADYVERHKLYIRILNWTQRGRAMQRHINKSLHKNHLKAIKDNE